MNFGGFWRHFPPRSVGKEALAPVYITFVNDLFQSRDRSGAAVGLGFRFLIHIVLVWYFVRTKPDRLDRSLIGLIWSLPSQGRRTVSAGSRG